MRRVDLHCYPGTDVWIASQGPYAEALGRHPGTFIQAWGAVDPLKGPAAVDGAIAAVRDHHVLGFHFHPIMGHFAVDDPALNPLFETIAGLGVPVMVDVGTTGMGAGLPGGLGARLEHARPLAIDNLAARFPALTIVAAHPGWPWTDEMTAVALHKGNVYWELSGWAPKYFPPSLRTDIRGRLREKIMFGSDHPSLPYERILREWDELGYDQSVMDHHSIDQFAASTAVPYSTIRPAIFFASLLAAAPEVRASRTWTGLAGSGRTALIDHRDAAEAGLRVL